MPDTLRPVSPVEIIGKIHQNIKKIVDLKDPRYSKWLLKGGLHERYYPVAVVAALFAREITSIIYASINTDKTLEDYRRQIAALELTEIIKQLERQLYQSQVLSGESTFFRVAPVLSRNLSPSSLLVFSRPNNSLEESVYLFSPSIAPPSPALGYIKRGVAATVKK